MHKIYSIVKKIIEKLKVYKSKKIEVKKIRDPRRVKIQKMVNLSKENINNINHFFKTHYGKKVSLNWHKNYYAISGNFDYKFFPELLFIPEFERLSNSPKYFNCLQDKNILDLVIKGVDYVNMPNVYVRCSNGIYSDELFIKISFNKVLEKLDNKEFFIKPTIDSNSGKGCKICKIFNGIDIKTGEKLENIIANYGSNFIAQEVVKNSKSMSCLHPSSLNTVRVITYILNGEVYHMPALLRIGRNNNFLDNAHAGGIFVGVKNDGKLLEYAHSEFGEKYDRHPDTGVIFKDYSIKGFEKILDVAYKLQVLFPQVGCINWDLTLDEKENVILLEGNMRGGSIWLPQMAHGVGGFGDNTEEVLHIIKQQKVLYENK